MQTRALRQWEYKVVVQEVHLGIDEGELEAKLNNLGREGWELVGIATHNGMWAALKRERAGD